MTTKVLFSRRQRTPSPRARGEGRDEGALPLGSNKGPKSATSLRNRPAQNRGEAPGTKRGAELRREGDFVFSPLHCPTNRACAAAHPDQMRPPSGASPRHSPPALTPMAQPQNRVSRDLERAGVLPAYILASVKRAPRRPVLLPVDRCPGAARVRIGNSALVFGDAKLSHYIGVENIGVEISRYRRCRFVRVRAMSASAHRPQDCAPVIANVASGTAGKIRRGACHDRQGPFQLPELQRPLSDRENRCWVRDECPSGNVSPLRCAASIAPRQVCREVLSAADIGI
jgi:hypothetical protein